MSILNIILNVILFVLWILALGAAMILLLIIPINTGWWIILATVIICVYHALTED